MATLAELAILVVDDDEAILEMLDLYLSEKGYQVTTKACPREGLTELRDHAYDLVLSDIRMAGMDGFEFLRIVRMNHPDIGIILMTGHSDAYPISKALAAGADGYLTKPFSLPKLGLLFEEAYWAAISRQDWWEQRAVNAD